MPFVKPLEYEKHVFQPWEELTGNCIIPLYDEAVWERFPSLRTFYNKLVVANIMGYQCGPHGIIPSTKTFPVASKPIYNLHGDGIGFKIFETPEQLQSHYQAGHFWMPLFEGTHLSTDFLIHHNEVIWSASFKGVPLKKDKTKFEYWHYVDVPVPESVYRLINLLPHDYCGAINIETIGGNVIEFQGRFSTQFCMFYGDEWFTAMIELYKNKVATMNVPKSTAGYSIPVWWYTTNVSMPTMDHVVITIDESNNRVLHPKRLALVQHTNLQEGLKIRNELYKYLETHDTIHKTRF